MTTSSTYSGARFETVEIPGTYRGVHAATVLRVQVHGPEGWTTLPLPLVTLPTGEFHAYVQLGRGRHRVRLADPAAGVYSPVVVVSVT